MIIKFKRSETVNHLFMTCRGTMGLLHGLLTNKTFLRSCSTRASLWEDCAMKGGGLGNGELLTAASVWWSVWLERNRRIFDLEEAVLGLALSGHSVA